MACLISKSDPFRSEKSQSDPTQSESIIPNPIRCDAKKWRVDLIRLGKYKRIRSESITINHNIANLTVLTHAES